MTNEHRKRLESIEAVSHKLLEYLYYFEVLFPKTGKLQDPELGNDYQILMFDMIEYCYQAISAFGTLLSDSGTNYQNEQALKYIEGLMEDIRTNVDDIDFPLDENFMNWIEKHKAGQDRNIEDL